MKLLAFAILVFTISAKAELPAVNSVSSEMPAAQPYSGYSARGIKVSLVKPFLTVSAKFDDANGEFTASDRLNQANGLSVGYVYLPVNQVGFTTNLAYIDMNDNGENAGLYRIDGNVAYAVTPSLNFKGGINLTRFNTKDMNSNLSPQIGFQASLGLQFTKNLGLDAGAVVMRQKGKNDMSGLVISESGPEVSLNGTF